MNDAFAAAAAASVHPTVRGWYDEAALLANARAGLAPELRLVGDLSNARAFEEAFPLPGVAAPQYANRIVRLGDGLDALAGIRARPSESAFFVDLVAASRPLADAAELADVVRRLGVEFAAFRPRWARLFAADERLVPDAGLVGDFVVAARVADLRAAAADEAVSVVRRGAADVFDDYARLYAEFHAEAPRNVELAAVEDFDTLARWERDGGVFEIRVGGGLAGHCGARRWPRYGVAGWCAAEIILARRFRGRGLAASAHRKMAALLDAAPGDALWAEVHEDNAPSLRAGLRAGYSVIGRVLRVAIAATD